MSSFYEDFRQADFERLEDLAAKWKDVHENIKGLDDTIRDEVLSPLKDKGYWEGMAAPYAWTQIDNMQRQVAAAIKVARAVQRTMEDGVGELKSAQRRLKDAVTRFQRAGMVVVVDGGQAVVERAQCTVDQPDPRKGEDVTEAQRELDEILRDAFLADQELAITLTANIGLDMWFNTGKLRSDTDSTGSIGVDLYDALDRAARGEDPHPEKNHQSPRDVLVNWVTGTGESEKVFTQNDPFTEQVRASESMKDIRKEVVRGWGEERKWEGNAAYSISELSFPEMVGTYAEDMAGLSGVDNLWGGDTNEAQSLLGSYAVKYEVKSVDPDGSLVVRYTLTNDTDMESALPGYWGWQERLNHDRGPGRDIKETMTWTERIGPDGEPRE